MRSLRLTTAWLAVLCWERCGSVLGIVETSNKFVCCLPRYLILGQHHVVQVHLVRLWLLGNGSWLSLLLATG